MMLSFHILDNFHILVIFHILDFYMNFYKFLFQPFHVLENFFIVSYFCTKSKLQCKSLKSTDKYDFVVVFVGSHSKICCSELVSPLLYIPE